MIAADKMNFSVANLVKRIYHIIREECSSAKVTLKSDQHLDSLSNLISIKTLSDQRRLVQERKPQISWVIQ